MVCVLHLYQAGQFHHQMHPPWQQPIAAQRKPPLLETTMYQGDALWYCPSIPPIHAPQSSSKAESRASLGLTALYSSHSQYTCICHAHQHTHTHT
jgi:hypothetical protein